MSDPYVISDIDYSALPTAMLSLAKLHLRVDFTDDDEYIKSCLARAIEYFELYSGLSVFGASVEWTPAATADGVGFVQLPVQPVSDFEAVDADDVDVKASYQIRSTGTLTAPMLFASVDGSSIPAGLVVTLAVGIGTDLSKIPPTIVDRILRVAATLYEQRETIVLGSIEFVPPWINDLLIGAWVPRC